MVLLSSEPRSALTASCINITSVCSLFKDNPGIRARFLFSLDRAWRMIQVIFLKSSFPEGLAAQRGKDPKEGLLQNELLRAQLPGLGDGSVHSPRPFLCKELGR